jgi:O-antigen ligase
MSVKRPRYPQGAPATTFAEAEGHASVSAPVLRKAKSAEEVRTRLRSGLPLFAAPLIAILWSAPVVGALGGITAGGVSVSAIATTIALAALLLAFLAQGAGGPSRAMRLLALFFVLSGWLLVVGVANGNYPDMPAAQQTIVWISTGLCLVLASSLSRSQLRMLEPNLDRAAAAGAVVLAAAFVSTALLDSFTASPRIIGLTALVPLAWSLSRWKTGGRWRTTSLLLGILIFMTLSRTASLVALILVVATVLRNHRLRLRSIALVTAVAISGYLVTTRWTPFTERFTEGDLSLSVFGIRVNAMGRTEIWNRFWLASQSHLVTGNGAGSSRSFTESIAPGLGHPHQDYLRLIYEGGLIALFLWLMIIMFAAKEAFTAEPYHLKASNVPDYKWFAFALIVIVSITSWTDNTLVYPFMMLPFGLAIGLSISRHRAILRSLTS